MNRFIFLSVLLILSGCGQVPTEEDLTSTLTANSGGTETPSSPDSTPLPPSAPPSAPPISLTVYSLTKTIATLFSGGTTTSVQGTGKCFQYLSQTYCLDDGIKVLSSSEFTYWGLKIHTTGALVACPGGYGSCTNDPMTDVRVMSANVTAKLNTVSGSAHRSAAEVLASGTTLVVSCTESTGILTCPDFTVDTNQTPL